MCSNEGLEKTLNKRNFPRLELNQNIMNGFTVPSKTTINKRNFFNKKSFNIKLEKALEDKCNNNINSVNRKGINNGEKFERISQSRIDNDVAFSNIELILNDMPQPNEEEPVD